VSLREEEEQDRGAGEFGQTTARRVSRTGQRAPCAAPTGYRLLLPRAAMRTGIAEALSPHWHGRSRRGDMAGCIKGHLTFSFAAVA
jgi:hypothetical protein